MLPKMRLLDPDKTLFDWISFDGASNVQKAGSLIEQYFPRCTVSVGVEHTVSLLFGKVMAICPMKELCGFAKKVGCRVCMYILEVAHSNSLFCLILAQGRLWFSATCTTCSLQKDQSSAQQW